MNNTFAEHLHFLLRWFHFLAGITWIGMLYYFNFVQTPFFGKAEAPVKSGMIRGLVPEALWWFRWGAMVTFATGWLMVIVYMMQGVRHSALYTIMSGGLMGTLMWYNVWWVIWPAQQVVIASANQVAGGGQPIPEAADKGKRAGLASRTNMVLSMPMLLLMAGQTHMIANPSRGWILLLLAVITMVALEYNALTGFDQPRQKFLGNLKQAIHVGLGIGLVFWVFMAFVTKL